MAGAEFGVTALGIRLNRWIPIEPTVKQYVFLSDAINGIREVLFGGAAGGGKSQALLAAAAQYVDVPGYAALLIRKDRQRLILPNGLIPKSQEWWRGTAAKWIDDDHMWRFPSGATISFGYLETDSDKYRYASAEFQAICFDEVTELREPAYRFLFSRLRRPMGLDVPLRMRAASNPGGIGHDWCAARFMGQASPDRRYIPSKLSDNPHIDAEEYLKSLANLDPVTRRRLVEGDWSAREPGGYFQRQWFDIVDSVPAKAQRVRYWDLASSEAREGSDPDWTAGCKVARDKDGIHYVEDMRHVRLRPHAVERLVRNTAEADGQQTTIFIEREPGASSAMVIDHYRRRVLMEYAVREDKVGRDKITRAQPVSAQAEAKNIKLVRGAWNGALLDELEAFPEGSHDDQVDALTGAMRALAQRSLVGLKGIYEALEDVGKAAPSRWAALRQ